VVHSHESLNLQVTPQLEHKFEGYLRLLIAERKENFWEANFGSQKEHILFVKCTEKHHIFVANVYRFLLNVWEHLRNQGCKRESEDKNLLLCRNLRKRKTSLLWVDVSEPTQCPMSSQSIVRFTWIMLRVSYCLWI
jgi:hypothetical protein